VGRDHWFCIELAGEFVATGRELRVLGFDGVRLVLVVGGPAHVHADPDICQGNPGWTGLVGLPGGDEGGERGGCLLAPLAGHRLGADPVHTDSPWPTASLIAGTWHDCVRAPRLPPTCRHQRNPVLGRVLDAAGSASSLTTEKWRSAAGFSRARGKRCARPARAR
jgi:hypothetical protein